MMKNLIKNELFKLNHRTETKVLLIFAILVTIVLNFMNYYFSETNENSYQKQLKSMIKFDEDMKKSADNIEDKIYYYSDYEINQLKLKYPLISAETGYINQTISDLVEEMYRNQFTNGISSESYLEVQKEYEEALQKLENYDWKQEINEEIKANQEVIDVLSDTTSTNSSTQTEIDYYQEVIRVLNYRLKNNIPQDGSNASNTLDEYLESLQTYKMMNKNVVTHQDKIALMEVEKALNIGKYELDHDLIKDQGNSYTTIAEELLSVASGQGFMIMFVAIFIASMIIPTEFEKGTIKQLLVKPYTRTEILVSKMIATILYFIGYTIFFLVVNWIVVGIFAGFNTIKAPIIVYDFNSKTATQVGLIPELIKCFLLVLPRFLLTMFIANLFAIGSKSTVLAMFVGLSLNMSDFTMLQKPIAKFILSNCWDFNVFANGGISMNEYVTLTSSVIVVVVTTIVVLLLSNVVFKRKEIKNQ